jgi:hypothetical protein
MLLMRSYLCMLITDYRIITQPVSVQCVIENHVRTRTSLGIENPDPVGNIHKCKK